MKPTRGYEALRRRRWSQAGFSYFITLCTADRQHGLTAPRIAADVQSEIQACETSGHWRVCACVIMPDHLHVLAVLCGPLQLGQIIGRLKTKTRALLAANDGLRWQANYYEHRLRPDESMEDVLRYLFLNPYRAGLVAEDELYPWFWLHAEESAWFNPALMEDERPFPEWLR